ncbi:phosphotransferase [Nocardioides sp. WL0053]|uniref:Phosphotransferase n=1 Tax=Nocardioides jiangsuensis TaxID=2866161 RepID=A0ABS7RIU0_9ACTN|nr:phosphotransferase [Nocardioides jiangsuensis]MBY9073988.1 phosphotransferase [Nocardioides jiangsuensis]
MVDDTQARTAPPDISPSEMLRTSALRSGGRAPKPPFDEVALLRGLEKEYDLGDWLAWSPTRYGASNDSWFVETEDGDVVVRRSHDLKTADGARFERALIEYLVARGYPAPAVVPTRSGQGSVTVEGVLHMVMRRLPGGPYDRESPGHLRAAARGLGRFHRLVGDLPTDQTAEESSTLVTLSAPAQERLRFAFAVVEPLLRPDRRYDVRADVDALVRDMATVHDGLTEQLPELTYLVTHGSYGPTSLLLRGDRLTGVVDYDRAAHDLLSLDLAYATWVFCGPDGARRRELGVDPERLSTFLRHYRTQASPTAGDLRALPAAMRARRLVKVTKKSENLLHKHAYEPRDADQADKFARTLAVEASQSRWLEEHASDLRRLLTPS